VPHVRLFTDPAEGRNPQSLFEVAPISQAGALARWPGAKQKQAIEAAKEFDWSGMGAKSSLVSPRADKIIEVVHSWRLPHSPEEPGTWCTSIGGEVMDHGDWDAPAFPFVFLGWEPHRDGFWWSGVADECGQLARVAGDVDERLLRRFKIASRSVTYYKNGSVRKEDLELNDEHVNIPYDDVPPQDAQIPPFAAMEVEFARWKVQQTWAASSISESNAAARREPGINSGIGLITLNDTKTGVQLPKAKAYEQAFVDLAHQYVWRLRELEEHNKDMVLKFPGKRLIMQIKWNEADVEDDMFSVTVGEASALPRDPAGRQQIVQEMYNNGLVQPDTARRLMGWPDLESELDTDEAETEYVDMLIEMYLDANREEEDSKPAWSDFDYEPPTAFIMNKPAALKRFGAAWFKAKVDQYTLPRGERAKVEFNLTLLARYIKELDALYKNELESQQLIEQQARDAEAQAQEQAQQAALAQQQQAVAQPVEQAPPAVPLQ
jgi:hypothetical protein